LLFCSKDIDECTLDIDICDHNCTNNLGSYTCLCRTGYSLDSDGHSCNGEFWWWLERNIQKL